jgi:hypothetical protein
MKYNNKFYNNNKDFYKESVIQAFKEKLNEATTKLQKLKKASGLSEGFPTVADAKARHEKEKTTGKFDKKEIKPGVTQYTRKSSTFDDGGDDKDTKKAKKAGKVKEGSIQGGVWTADAPKKGAPNVPVPSPDEGPTSSAKRPVKPGTTPEKAKLDPRYKTDPAFKKEVDTASQITFKEGKKPDFLDMDKDGNKKEPMKKAVADKKKNPFAKTTESLKGGQKKLDVDKDGKLEKSDFAKLRAKKTTESADKCNHTVKGEKCPVHGLKECGMYEASHQAKTTMKHVKNPTAGEKKAAKDIKPGVKGYSDRVAMLKSAEKDGRLKEASKPDFLDMDKDGNKKEPMKKAVADKKKNPFVKK